MIITISRESGSGGSEIGHKLADKLGVPCYDKTVTQLTADISGFAKEIIEHSADKTPMPFDYSGYYYFYDTAGSEKWLPVYDQIYLAQSKAIRRLAAGGDCVIVGRCASHVLAERKIPNISVFVRPSSSASNGSWNATTSTRRARSNISARTTRRARRITANTRARNGAACRTTT